MGLPYMPPQEPPAIQQPPTEINDTNKQQQDQTVKNAQDQFQDQFQKQQNTIGELLQKQSTESDADSSADSSSVNSATQTNVQVNNNSNRIEYGSFKIPETTLNLNGYVTENGDFGAVVGINIPLGGGPRKSIREALDIQVQADRLAFEQSYTSTCANIEDGGFVVTKDAEIANMLSKCSENLTKTAVVPRATPTPTVNNNNDVIDQLRAENEQLRILIAQLAEKIDNNTVNGGY